LSWCHLFLLSGYWCLRADTKERLCGDGEESGGWGQGLSGWDAREWEQDWRSRVRMGMIFVPVQLSSSLMYVLHWLATGRVSALKISASFKPRWVVLRQSYLLLFGIPSPTHSFFPGLKPSFSVNPTHCSPSFLLLKYLICGFPGLF